MCETCGWIIAFRLDSRIENAIKVQEVLTKYGCNIQARLGLHEASKDYCANYGLIILQCCGTEELMNAFLADLNAVDGISAKMMSLD